jgi:hypothetical protein
VGFLKNVKAVKDAMSQGIAQGMSGQGPTEEALASLTPEQRAAYDAQMARVAEAQGQVAIGQAQVAQLQQTEMASRPLLGPAGEHLYGGDPAQVQAQLTEAMGQGMGAYLKASWKATGPKAKDVATPRGEAVSADRGQQIAHEWTQREQARAPYLAPARFPVVFTRIATRARDQVADVTAHLAATGLAARPELVFGLYPVPDHIGNNLGRDKSRYMEWDVVHAATEALPPAAPPGATFLPADVTWIARASGQESPLDEDLATAFLTAAHVGPEHCLGVARGIRTKDRSGGEDTEGSTMIQVTGVHVFGPPALGDHVRDQFAAAAPIPLAPGPTPGTHTMVLNWGAIAKAVHKNTQKPFEVPSPFPYLPSTPQELLKSYLDIVGVNPFDCWAAEVTEDHLRDMRSRQRDGWFEVNKNWGDSQPCADGKDRGRMQGGRRVVVAYRDRPEYEAGRQRWAAYEREVLQSQLEQRTGARRPVEAMQFGSLGSGTRRLIRMAERVANVAESVAGDGTNDTDWDKVPPHRYCWPPTDVK